MKRLFVGIITALCAIAVTAQLVPYRQLSTNEFKVGSFPAVQLRLNPTQFNTGGFPITITNVAGVFGAGGGSGITNLPANSPGYLTNNGTGTLSWVAGSGGGSGNVVASGTNDVGWLLTASTNDGIHATWSAPIWTNSPAGKAAFVNGITNLFLSAGIPFTSVVEDAQSLLNIIQTDSDYAIVINSNVNTNNWGFAYFLSTGEFHLGTRSGGDLVFAPSGTMLYSGSGPTLFSVNSSGEITTGDPGSGTAAWKLGNILSVSGTNVTFQIQIGGTNITVSGHL